LDSHSTTEGLIALVIAIDRDYLSKIFEAFRGFFIGGFEALAMAAPWGIEPVNEMSAASLYEEPANILYNLAVVDQPASTTREFS